MYVRKYTNKNVGKVFHVKHFSGRAPYSRSASFRTALAISGSLA
jgi:hypothetical protein